MTAAIPPSTERLSTALTSVMDAVLQAAMDLNVDLPTQQIVTTGNLAHDCEQVLVIGSGLTTGSPTSADTSFTGGGACATMWSLVVTVDIVRCSPTTTTSGTTNIPKVTEALGTASTDVGVLMDAAAILEETAFSGMTASITLKPPSGNYRSTSLTIRIGLA